MTPLALDAPVANGAADTLSAACGPRPGVACHLVWDVSQNASAARLVDSYLAGPINVVLRVAFVVILALVTRMLVDRPSPG